MTMTTPFTGYEVYNSPEFKALCERFGIVHDLRCLEITLKLTEDEFIVTQSYRTAPTNELAYSDRQGKVVDLTTLDEGHL